MILIVSVLAGDMTGSHSIYTMHQGHEIMFHVSTMLPFSKDNKQQVRFTIYYRSLSKYLNIIRRMLLC